MDIGAFIIILNRLSQMLSLVKECVGVKEIVAINVLSFSIKGDAIELKLRVFKLDDTNDFDFLIKSYRKPEETALKIKERIE
ncbi:MAG: hypothetical protein HOO91_17725 [Bacteroidales bacterium]|nr:hypothetical protein [Bacteroidales bacterium]